MTNIKLKPIGVVHNEIKQTGYHDCKDIVSEIEVDEKWAELLDGIEEFSHIIILFWMHAVSPDSPRPAKVHPRGRADLPRGGPRTAAILDLLGAQGPGGGLVLLLPRPGPA